MDVNLWGDTIRPSTTPTLSKERRPPYTLRAIGCEDNVCFWTEVGSTDAAGDSLTGQAGAAHTASVVSNWGCDGARRASVRGETGGLWEKAGVWSRVEPQREQLPARLPVPAVGGLPLSPLFPGAGLHGAVDVYLWFCWPPTPGFSFPTVVLTVQAGLGQQGSWPGP